MSYNAEATLFYGVLTDHEILEKAFNLVVGEDNWFEIERIVEEFKLKILQLGNMCLGDGTLYISVCDFSCYEYENPIILSPETMKISDEKLEILKTFMEKYDLKGQPSWHLGASYV